MTYEKATDILEYTRQLHRKLAHLYKRLEKRTKKERVKMLLDYLKRHEYQIQQALDEFEKEGSKKILNTWFQYLPEKMDLKNLEKLQNDRWGDEVTEEDVINIALEFDQYLVNLYREMAEYSETDEVREVFQNLSDHLQYEEKIFVRDVQRFQDF